MNDTGSANRNQRTKTLVKVSPFGILLVSLLLNHFVLGVNPLLVALPSNELIAFVAIAVALLVINHSWLMTTTELTRIRFNRSIHSVDAGSTGWGRQQTALGQSNCSMVGSSHFPSLRFKLAANCWCFLDVA